MKLKRYSKYLLVVLFIVVTYFAIMLLKPFIIPLLTSVILAYVFYPIYKLILKLTKRKNISALLISLLIIILITVPLFLMINAVSKEVMVMYTIGEQKLAAGTLFVGQCSPEDNFCNKLRSSRMYLQTTYYLQENLEDIRSFIIEKTNTFLFSIPKRLLEVFITLFVMFYLFRDGDKIINKLRKTLALEKRHEDPIVKRVGEATYAIIYGNGVIAIIEGLLGGLGFWLFGVPSPILWGIVMAILAFLPVIGAGVVWGIVAVFMILGGKVISGLLLAAYGLLFITSIDLFVKPKVIGDRAQIHPILIVIGLIGGVTLFGPVGFIIGPLILGLLMTFTNIYEKERQHFFKE